MIPADSIRSRARLRPNWSDHDLEQDILLDRLIIEVATDPLLGSTLVLTGGTCLHKLWLPEPWRFSKDLDYVRTTDGPLGPIYGALRRAGAGAGFDRDHVRTRRGRIISHLQFRGTSESGAPIRITVDFPTGRTDLAAPAVSRPFNARDGQYSAGMPVQSVAAREMLATKVAALFGRRQARDAYDVWVGAATGLAAQHEIAAVFQQYRQPGWNRRAAADNFADKWADRGYRRELESFGAQAPQPFNAQDCRDAVLSLLDECARLTSPSPPTRRPERGPIVEFP